MSTTNGQKRDEPVVNEVTPAEPIKREQRHIPSARAVPNMKQIKEAQSRKENRVQESKRQVKNSAIDLLTLRLLLSLVQSGTIAMWMA